MGPATNIKEEENSDVEALRSVGGDKTRAAELLGISLRTLYYKLKGLDGAVTSTAGRAVYAQAELSSVSNVR
jgi:DNA-binding NtrC family response regulator